MKALFYLQGAGCVFEDTFFTVQVNRLFFIRLAEMNCFALQNIILYTHKQYVA